jgi:hypothetical protein
MAAAQTIFTAGLRPSTKLHIGRVLFGPTFQLSSLGIFQSYFEYYVEELHLHQFATSPQAQLAANLDVQTHEDVLPIVSILRGNLDTKKSDLRELLRKEFVGRDDRRLDRSVDLAIRLWLMVNLQEPEYQSLRSQTPCIQWEEGTTLRVFSEKLFPHSRWKITAKESRLHPYFTAVNMVRICGLKVEWTTSLEDHLRLDRRRKALRVFPYKCCLQAMLSEESNSGFQNRCAVEQLCSKGCQC